jgi:hypothetical protein
MLTWIPAMGHQLTTYGRALPSPGSGFDITQLVTPATHSSVSLPWWGCNHAWRCLAL